LEKKATMTDTPDVLKKIIDYKQGELSAAKSRVGLAALRARIADCPPVRGFLRSLRSADEAGQIAVIAEVKKGSPSKGIIRADFDPVAIARTYEANGATCLSVLTDEHFFFGHLDFLAGIRNEVNIPLLRKDFIVDDYQIYEARAAGADAILLIAAVLDLSRLQGFLALAGELSLDVLLEVHDERELAMALATDCPLVGINNRNLHTFVTDLGTTGRLCALMPPDRFAVAESGINSRDDVVRLRSAGARAFLVGESLMREQDFGRKLRELRGCE
jgi:indole-3-glycerol phosphate synthase